jgi:hypothetical protein
VAGGRRRDARGPRARRGRTRGAALRGSRTRRR